VYSVFAWLGLVLKNQSAYWDVVRQCYESVAIYSFFEFLTCYLGGRQHMATVLESKGDMKHMFPLCWMSSWSMHVKFYRYTRLCVIQYIPVQIICAIIIFVTSLTGYYQDGHFAANDAYIYTAFVINCSQIAALYGLVEFYQALKHELIGTNPFYKFLCIKGVVFFTFWQSVFLSMLVAVNVITPTVTYTTNQESYGIDDFVICIEMFFFALAHWYAFPPHEFKSYAPPDTSLQITRIDGGKTEVKADEMDEITYVLSDKQQSGQIDVAAAGKDEVEPAYVRKEEEHGVEMAQVNGGGGGELGWGTKDGIAVEEKTMPEDSSAPVVQTVETDSMDNSRLQEEKQADDALSPVDVHQLQHVMVVHDVDATQNEVEMTDV
jgi:hypothetical protein